MQKKFANYITNLWEKSAAKKRLTFFDRFVFLFLCVLEFFYKICFFASQFFKKKNGNQVVPNLKVVSVGNLTVGGTGKSVVAGFLVRILGAERCAIVSRGYGGSLGKKNILVGDGIKIFCTPDICGDEPCMLAQSLHVPIVVGRDRYRSCLMLNDVSYAILDDAYQNHQVKKDIEILLLDARSPFGNNHCLPAGPLREKDYSRADVIFLTHADEVSSEKISEIKTKMLSSFPQDKIFCGRHKSDGIFLFDEQKIDPQDYENKKFLVLAGIGSFDGFVQCVKNFGMQVDQVLQFPDHHKYSQNDIFQILNIIKNHDLCGVFTTQKDWSKLSFLIDKNSELKIFVSRIAFEFLDNAEEELFKNILI